MIFLFDNCCKVVNKSKEQYDVYIGRGTPFGNPYVIGRDGTREEVIAKYKAYFYDRIKHDKNFLRQVMALKNKVLGCHCKPLACHGDVIKEFLEGK